MAEEIKNPPELKISKAEILKIKRGDVLCFHFEEQLCSDEIEWLKKSTGELFEKQLGFNVPILVIEKGAKITVVRGSEAMKMVTQKLKQDPNRQTGRTTKMLKEAVKMAISEKQIVVFVVMHNLSAIDYALNILSGLVDKPVNTIVTGKIKNGFRFANESKLKVVPYGVDWPKHLLGHNPRHVFVDHHVGSQVWG